MDRARRAMPVANKTCHNKYLQKCQELHKKRLKEMKCSIDNKPPDTIQHLSRNRKKEKILEERYTSIERENRLLLEKMSYIMKRNTLDNRNTSTQYARSLNKEQRRRDLAKITRENQAILRRIQQSEPAYSHAKWAEEARRNEEYMKNICEYKNGGGGDEYDDEYEEGMEGAPMYGSSQANSYANDPNMAMAMGSGGGGRGGGPTSAMGYGPTPGGRVSNMSNP